ncbi:hemoglobin [Lutibacter oricola]|uniref:Hemoglobin n=1 Tax=Lutibacter oricola TaxID=762486 RepID=A0A1H3GFA1_9FLAO|nr:group III truncated hemoglobin [Lutibacter oricola]SDY02042.1 hemoglobin [Lutibacter oricola]
MKKDIENREDLYLLVKTFYVKLMNDAEIKHFFNEFNNPDLLEEHLQVLVNFWDNILFYSGGYRKNAMQPHLEMNKKNPITENHFNIWLSRFKSSVDDLFFGENAHAIKSRAESVAIVMKIKISEQNN